MPANLRLGLTLFAPSLLLDQGIQLPEGPVISVLFQYFREGRLLLFFQEGEVLDCART